MTQRRSYSRWNPKTGDVDWIDPSTPVTPPRVRSRIETDDEVRARLTPAHHAQNPHYPPEHFRGTHGRSLDDLLKIYGLPPRRYVDEVIS